MNRAAMSRIPASIAACLLALALAACSQRPEPPLAGATIGGEFDLVDTNGKPVHWRDFKGKYRMIYFGYTFCPDACPTDLTTMMRGFDQFAKDNPGKAGKVQPIFVSVDPARDTPPRVGEFAAAFSPRLLGLTGSEANVAKAAKVFAVWYAKGEQTPGGYLVNHTRIAYLMDPDGKPLVVLATDKGPKAVAADLAEWVD